jgi:hypothetical protein
MKMETTQSFRSYECDGPPSLAPHRAGSVGVTSMRDQPKFVASRVLHSSGGKMVDALSAPFINPSAGSESSLRFSLVA